MKNICVTFFEFGQVVKKLVNYPSPYFSGIEQVYFANIHLQIGQRVSITSDTDSVKLFYTHPVKTTRSKLI